MKLLPPLLLAATLTAALIACGGGEGSMLESSLTSSVSSLTLAASGTARLITITNQGPLATRALQTEATGLPSGSSLRSTCPAVLQPGAMCVLLVTPGNTPSATPGDRTPVAATVTVNAANALSLTVPVAVLSYGSVHQGGYVFAINDDTPLGTSIAGKVLATQDTDRVYWSPTAIAIPGISDDSVAGLGSCDGAVDGRCNTKRIVAQYPSSDRNYPAALCEDSTHDGYTDWYMPALCELAYDNDAVIQGICGTRAAPRLPDNAKSRLADSGPLYFFDIAYWSSTQSAANRLRDAQMALYDVNRTTLAREKQEGLLASKCARYITP